MYRLLSLLRADLVRKCGLKAICHDQRDELIELEVSSRYLRTGDTVTEIPDGYGCGAAKDVVTS